MSNVLLITGALSPMAYPIIKQMLEEKTINKIHICDIKGKENELKGLKKKILIDNNHIQVQYHSFNALDKDDRKNFFDTFSDAIDYYVNLIGINYFKNIRKIDEEDWDLILDTNLKSSFFLVQQVCENMIVNKKRGSIVLVASQHGIVANGYRAPYCVSKAGVIHLTKVLALEYSPFKINVNCVSPSYILSDTSRNFLENRNVRKEYISKIPLQRYSVPKEVSSAICFLLSKDNSYITGSNIVIDGGYTIW